MSKSHLEQYREFAVDTCSQPHSLDYMGIEWVPKAEYDTLTQQLKNAVRCDNCGGLIQAGQYIRTQAGEEEGQMQIIHGSCPTK